MYLYIEDLSGSFIGPFASATDAANYAELNYPDHFAHRPRGAGYRCEILERVNTDADRYMQEVNTPEQMVSEAEDEEDDLFCFDCGGRVCVCFVDHTESDYYAAMSDRLEMYWNEY